MKISHEGKGAIVTGGSRGIGLAIAKELVSAGAHVMITGRKRTPLEEAAAELGCAWRVCHAADEAEATACIEETRTTFGRIDLLVNNAGTSPAWGPTLDIDRGLAAKLTEVNQWAPLLWTQIVWRAWMGEHGGSVVNITSIGAISPAAQTGYYNGTKAALGLLTQQLAAELAPTVRVNAVAPGLISTEMAAAIPDGQLTDLATKIPLGRLGASEDIAAATSFLLSEHAGWITGVVLPVDGGALQAGGRPAS